MAQSRGQSISDKLLPDCNTSEMEKRLSPTVFSRCIEFDAFSRITAACYRTGTLPQLANCVLYVQRQSICGQICNFPRNDRWLMSKVGGGGRLLGIHISNHRISTNIIIFLGPARGHGSRWFSSGPYLGAATCCRTQILMPLNRLRRCRATRPSAAIGLGNLDKVPLG